jgi:hypothetical protein
MTDAHPTNEAYSEEGSTLFRGSDGRYMMGLAELFGAHLCGGLPNPKLHEFAGDTCSKCGVKRTPYRYLID